MVQTIIQVALGGAAGAMLRWGVVQGLGFALGTLAANVAGSLAIGLLWVMLPERVHPLILIGVLGGFTTFSAFSLDTLRLIESGRAGLALAYAGASVIASLGACWAGMTLGRMVT